MTMETETKTTEDQLLASLADARAATTGPEYYGAAEQLDSIRKERAEFIKDSTAREKRFLDEQARARDKFSKDELKTCETFDIAEKSCLHTIETLQISYRERVSAVRAFYTAQAMGLDKPEGRTFSAVFEGSPMPLSSELEPGASIRSALFGDPDDGSRKETIVTDDGSIRTRITWPGKPSIEFEGKLPNLETEARAEVDERVNRENIAKKLKDAAHRAGVDIKTARLDFSEE